MTYVTDFGGTSLCRTETLIQSELPQKAHPRPRDRDPVSGHGHGADWRPVGLFLAAGFRRIRAHQSHVLFYRADPWRALCPEAHGARPGGRLRPQAVNRGHKKRGLRPFFQPINAYLLLIYIVTSKPKRMSLYSGVSHFIVVLLKLDYCQKLVKLNTGSLCVIYLSYSVPYTGHANKSQ